MKDINVEDIIAIIGELFRVLLYLGGAVGYNDKAYETYVKDIKVEVTRPLRLVHALLGDTVNFRQVESISILAGCSCRRQSSCTGKSCLHFHRQY